MDINEHPWADTPRYKQFVEDMEAANIPWRAYKGRFGYDGPAAESSRDDGISEQDVYRATAVELTRDGMGLDFIFYPR